MGEHSSYMMRAIDLAQRAEGHTSPNPMVGCVLVKNDRIVGEGFHARPGSAHAEAAALRAAGAEAKGATAYVTLEPCNHYGRTPPCAEALIKAGVAEVYFAISDPNPVAKGGAATLKAAGIPAHQGLCEKEAHHLIRHWLHRQAAGRPFVTAKFAASLDGRTSTSSGESQWITSPEARAQGHLLRAASDAILVGVETVLADNPSLTARPAAAPGKPQAVHPLRIILDSTGRMPQGAKILRTTTPGNTLIATTKKMPLLKKTALEGRGAQVLVLPADGAGRVDLHALMAALAEQDILSVMVEGGSTVLGSFFDAALVDEVWAFLAPCIIGGTGRPAIGGLGIESLAARHHLSDLQVTPCGPDFLLTGQVMRADAATKQEERA